MRLFQNNNKLKMKDKLHSTFLFYDTCKNEVRISHKTARVFYHGEPLDDETCHFVITNSNNKGLSRLDSLINS